MMQTYLLRAAGCNSLPRSQVGRNGPYYRKRRGGGTVSSVLCSIGYPLAALIVTPRRGPLWCCYSAYNATNEKHQMQGEVSAAPIKTFPLRAFVPEGSFRATATSYELLVRARIFKRHMEKTECQDNTEKGQAKSSAPLMTGGVTQRTARGAEITTPSESTPAASSAAGQKAAASVDVTLSAKELLFGKEAFERLRGTRAWKSLLDYPQELFPGEYKATEVPSAFSLDWPSLSTKKAPGFLPRRPAPWMHPDDVTAAVVSPSWVNIDDGHALEAAARCSNRWKPNTKGDERTVSTKGAAAEDSEPCSAGNGKTAGIAQTPPGAGGRLNAWDERLEKQKDAGTLDFISVGQFTPVREKDSGMPLNPILFTSSVTPSCAEDLHGEERLATFSMNQQELRLQQLQGQRQKSEGCHMTSFPQVHVRGRGILGKWGPNRTADAVVTAVNPVTNKLQVVLIRRTDGTGQYAFPGGFADNTDFPPFVSTAVREFLEEAVHFGDGAAAGTGRTTEAEAPALTAPTKDDGDKRAVAPSAALSRRAANTVGATGSGREEGYDWQQEESLEALKEVFGTFTWDAASGRLFWGNEDQIRPGTVIYAGYVDDARNTDNAWIETIAFHWHVAPSLYSRVHLRAGDDAAEGSAAFYDIRDDPRLIAENVDPLKDLYSSHSGILRITLKQQFPDFK